MDMKKGMFNDAPWKWSFSLAGDSARGKGRKRERDIYRERENGIGGIAEKLAKRMDQQTNDRGGSIRHN